MWRRWFVDPFKSTFTQAKMSEHFLNTAIIYAFVHFFFFLSVHGKLRCSFNMKTYSKKCYLYSTFFKYIFSFSAAWEHELKYIRFCSTNTRNRFFFILEKFIQLVFFHWIFMSLYDLKIFVSKSKFCFAIDWLFP